MNRVTKLAILEVAFNHNRWVRLEVGGESLISLIAHHVCIEPTDGFIYLYLFKSMDLDKGFDRAITFPIGQLDKVVNVEILEKPAVDLEDLLKLHNRFPDSSSFDVVAL